MREVVVERDIQAPRSAVWAVAADYPNIADWNTGVKKSYSTSADTQGVGAQRHCDLAPAGGLEETIREWVPEERMVISIDSTSKMPIKSGLASFDFGEADAVTPTRLRYQYETKWGPIGRLMGSMLDKQLQKGFTGFLADLETAAQAVR